MEQIFSLRNDKASVSLSIVGGCLTSYSVRQRDADFDILRPLYPLRFVKVSPQDSSSFPLIPYSNRIKQGRFDFRGTSYQLPLNFGSHPHSIHGVAWQEHWTMRSQSQNSIAMELNYSGEAWPFLFRAIQRFSLDGLDLIQEISITNLSDGPMPVGLGMHPFFPRHSNTRLTADVEKVWLTDETCLPTERRDCPTHWDLRSGVKVGDLICDNQFEPWKGVARIDWPDENVSVDISASEDLSRLVIFAPEDEDFFCIEPTSHITDAFNLTATGMTSCDTGMRILNPGEDWKVWMKLSPTLF